THGVEQVEARLDLDPASSASPPVMDSYQHTVSGFSEVLGCHFEFVPHFLPMRDVVPNRIQAIGRSLLGRVDHDVGIKDCLRLGTVADAVNLISEGSPHDLHVLLRHRPRSISWRVASLLLPQPGGFEGSVPRSLEIDGDYFVLPELPDDEDRVVNLSAAELSRAALTTRHEDAVFAKVLQFLCLDPIVAPVGEEIEHLSSGLLAPLGNEVGWRRSPECDVRCHQLGRSPEVPFRPLGEDGAQQLELLLRHRPRSISRYKAPRPALGRELRGGPLWLLSLGWRRRSWRCTSELLLPDPAARSGAEVEIRRAIRPDDYSAQLRSLIAVCRRRRGTADRVNQLEVVSDRDASADAHI